MTWSLNISGGDLSLGGPGGLSTVTSTDKLIQDLKCWLLEAIGTDPMHPDYGSTLDGGQLPGGVFQDGMIGGSIDAGTMLQVEAEVRRVMTAYQQQQTTRITMEQNLYQGKNTYTWGEILYSVNSVSTTSSLDTIIVNCQVTTANGNTLTFSQPVGSTTTS